MAEEIRFYPLDITYKVADGIPVIYIFGRTSDGKQICVADSTFEPYFYVIPKGGENLRDKLEKIKIEREGEIYRVVRTEAAQKKFLGEDTTAVKVYTKLPRDVPAIVDAIKEWISLKSIHEYDILFARRYLIDKGIAPLTLCKAIGKFTTQRMRVPVFNAEKVEQFSDDTIPSPRILSFDIETYSSSGKEIAPEKNPILMLSFYSNDFKKVFVWKRFKTELEYVEFVESEAELIQKFKETIDNYKPEVLAGYFSDGFDLPYIQARADKYKIKLDIGLDYSEMKKGREKTSNVEITGIVHLDVFRFIKAIFGGSMDADSYSLNAVASEILGEGKTDADINDLADVWDNKKEELGKFCEYNLTDSALAYKLCEKMIPDIIELVKMVGLKIYDVNRMGFSQLVEWYLMRQAVVFNEIAPNKPGHDEITQRRMQTYEGAFVFEPKPGIYKNIVVLDYRSLYPTIISAHNISPGTLRCDCCADSEIIDGKYWFCKKKKGFIPTVLEDIITRRMRIKEILKDKNSDKHKMLYARQNSLKILANSFYGYFGFFGARWYSIESAKSTTAYGRKYIHKVIDSAIEAGFNVIYSDTDSVFFTLDSKTRNDALEFLESINRSLPGLMELEFEGFYPAGIFVTSKASEAGAKKKYALLSEDGNLKIRGFEAIRRNWSIIAKEAQHEVLRIILRENNLEKAVVYIKHVISELREKKVPIEKVVIHTQLQRDVSEYDSIGPHVAIAQKLKNKGIDVKPGTIIKYVVMPGKDRIRDRVKLPEEITQNDYDSEYYINNQIIPSVERILNVLGYKKEDILINKDQEKLGRFF